MIEHRTVISGVATFEDRYIATAGYDHQVILWDAKKHEAVASGQHDHLVNQCQFSPDGRYLISSSSDYSARLWSLPSMKLKAVLNGHDDDVEGLAFHPNKEIIATSSRDHAIRLYTYSGDLINTLVGHQQDVLSVVWASDDEIISCSDDGTVKRWNAFTGCILSDTDLGGIETDTIVWGNGLLIAGNDSGEITLIDDESTLVVAAHQAGIKRLCFNAQLNRLISLSYDRTMKVWSVVANKLVLIKTTTLPSNIWPRSADFSGDKAIVLATFGSQYAIYNYVDDQWQHDHVKLSGSQNSVIKHLGDCYSIGDSGIVYKNNNPQRTLPSLCNFLVSVGRQLITGGQTGEVFNALTGEVIYQHHSPINCGCVFYKNNEVYLILGTYTGEAIILKEKGDEIIFSSEVIFHDNAIKGISAFGHLIFSVCATGAIAFHSIDDFSLIEFQPSGHDKIVNGCAHFSRDCFVSVSRDLTLRFNRLERQDIVETPHRHSIKCVAVSDDKQWIATGGYRGMLCAYHLQTDDWISVRVSHTGISCLTYDIEQKAFLASSYDGEIYTIPVSLLDERLIKQGSQHNAD